MIHKSKIPGFIMGALLLIIAGFIMYIITSNVEKNSSTKTTQKEQLYHKQIEKDICGKDTIYEVCFIPDSIWYKHH